VCAVAKLSIARKRAGRADAKREPNSPVEKTRSAIRFHRPETLNRIRSAIRLYVSVKISGSRAAYFIGALDAAEMQGFQIGRNELAAIGENVVRELVNGVSPS